MSINAVIKEMFMYLRSILKNLTYTTLDFIVKILSILGHDVLQLVKALRYQQKGRGFDSR